MISEQELAAHSFSEREGIFVTDAVQVEFLKSSGNTSLSQSRLLPLSTQAYAAVLKLGQLRARPYFNFIDFGECKRWYRERALKYSRTWLQELGLEFRFEGIDVAELDGPCQFLFFLHAVFIGGTAGRLIRASPEIEIFYIVAAENRLPLNFYFDSDVSAAVLRFVCEGLSRQARTIVMKQRPDYICPAITHLRFMNGRVDKMTFDQTAMRIPRSSHARVGFAPATVANHEQILEGIRHLGCQLVVFPSIWPTAPAFDGGRIGTNEYFYQLSSADGEWSTAVEAQLAELRRQFSEGRALSTLPACIIANSHLGFQFDYIFMRRWLSYANMIRRAVEFVAETPLDLFIHSDHFTAEGAILARLYRRSGTPIIVALHSGWPVDRNWASCDSSDSAMVPSKSCAERMRQLSGMSNIFITGAPTTQTYRSLVHAPALIANKRPAVGHRKIVLFVTNALELNCVPFTALDSYFETISFIGRIPESLEDRILIAFRTKPGQLGDDPILYRELCELPAEIFSFLDGLSFSQSLEVADCIVGVNNPTSGYFEIMQKGVPLIHLQTADAMLLQPDLPPGTIQCVAKLQDLWPAIEAVLFDRGQRQKVLEIQGQFISTDFTPSVSGGGDPVEAVVRQLLGCRAFPSLGCFPSSALRRRVAGRLWPTRRPIRLDESSLPRCRDGGAGHVDDVLLGSNGNAVIVGWAADMVRVGPAKAIHVFVNGLWRGEGSVGQPRTDVAEYYKDQRLEQSGFLVKIRLDGEKEAAALSVYSELHDATFFNLPNVINKPDAGQNG